MTFWPFWLGGAALAAVTVTHYLMFGSHLAVSGRLSVLVNRVRSRLAGEQTASDEELAAMMRAMTADEFGEAALEPLPGDVDADAPARETAPEAANAEPPGPVTFTTRDHLLFFGGLALGGLASALLAGTFRPSLVPRGELFAHCIGTGPGALAMLFLGGIFVGFGTRMSGGCTSGHGLIGVSRLSKAGLLATASFFGAGIAFSLVMEAVR